MTRKYSLSDSNRSSTPSKTLATDSTDNAVTDSELDLVTGGITVSKRTDVSSADLFLKCANGKHIAEVTIEI
jgi:type VI protein secretion system component Hcp